MVTNITISPIDGDSVVYLQDGSTVVVASGSEHSIQIVEKGFCTISDVGNDADATEHPPEWFIEGMEAFADAMRAAIGGPEVNPL